MARRDVSPQLAEEPGELSLYSVYGVRVQTAHPFSVALARASGPTDLHFETLDVLDREWGDSLALVYSSPLRDDNGESVLRVYSGAGHTVFSCTRVGDFRIARERILLFRHPGVAAEAIELRLLGPVLPFWAETYLGNPALHASAVAVDGRAVVFLSGGRGGKTCLAAALMQLGFPLLSDDIVVVSGDQKSVVAHAGFPQVKMWPEPVQHFLGSTQGLQRVLPGVEKLRIPVGSGGFGRFSSVSLPLGCVYLPERQDSVDQHDAVEISAVSAAEAFIELLRYSFSARLLDAMGLREERLEALAGIVRCTPIRRLRFRTGLDNLARVGEAVVADANAL